MTKAFGHMSKLRTFICRPKTGALVDDMYNRPQALLSSVVSGKRYLRNLTICEDFGLPKWPNLLAFWDVHVDVGIVTVISVAVHLTLELCYASSPQ